MTKKSLPFVFIGIIAFTILFFSITNAQEISKDQFSKNITPVVTPTPLAEPVAGFKSRITKKFFGTYVTPANSPIYPERFTGYHTGVDAEYEDVSRIIPVSAVADGKVAFSGYVKGYGGVVIINENINGQNILVLYGHLKPLSLIKKGSEVAENQQIGVLGAAYSVETNGERKHLHFAMLKGDNIDFRGYVLNKSDLQNWYNPLDFYPN